MYTLTKSHAHTDTTHTQKIHTDKKCENFEIMSSIIDFNLKNVSDILRNGVCNTHYPIHNTLILFSIHTHKHSVTKAKFSWI